VAVIDAETHGKCRLSTLKRTASGGYRR